MSEIKIKININCCNDCKHAGHSGAFTPGGAIHICRHRKAPDKAIAGVKDFRDITTKEIAHKVFDQKAIKNGTSIPNWCPLLKGFSYDDQ